MRAQICWKLIHKSDAPIIDGRWDEPGTRDIMPTIMRKAPLLLTLAAMLHGAVASADTYPRQPGVDAVHYVFRLAIDDGSDQIAGDATVTFKLAAAVREVILDLTSAASGKGMTVSAVSVGGRTVAFKHVADRLHVPLPSPPPAGD